MRIAPVSPDREVNLARSARRAKRTMRQAAKEMNVQYLWTLTTRETGQDGYFTRAAWVRLWQRFCRLVQQVLGVRIQYIAALERHPKNPDHLHLHFAVWERLPVHIMRRLWDLTLGGDGSSRGAATRGNVQAQHIRVPPGINRAARVARYISKYCSKSFDALVGFNEKRYWRSQVELLPVERDWLAGQTIAELVLELRERGIWPADDRSVFLFEDHTGLWMEVTEPLAGAPPPF
jgi:hypothetical protein